MLRGFGLRCRRGVGAAQLRPAQRLGGRESGAGDRAAPHRASAGLARRAAKTWSTWWPATCRRPGIAGRVEFRSPPKTSGAPPAHASAVAAASSRSARRCSGGCVERVQVDDPAAAASATPCMTRRSGRASARASRCSRDRARRARGSRCSRRRWRQQVRVAGRDRAPQPEAGVARGAAPSARSRRRRAPSRAGHHGGTSCSSATSHSQPASARQNSAAAAGARAAGSRAAVEEVPASGLGSRATRPVPARRTLPALAAPLPHRAPSSRAAELAALLDRALALKADAARLARARGPQRRARLRAALDAHAHLVRGRRSSSSAGTRWCCGRASCSSRAASPCATPRSCSRATSPRSGCAPARRRRSPSWPSTRRAGGQHALAARTTRARRWPTC